MKKKRLVCEDGYYDDAKGECVPYKRRVKKPVEATIGSRRAKLISPQLKNLQMNDDVYALRRKVIELIYEAKELDDLPRIEVRITEDDKEILGQGRMNQNIIWISRRAVTEFNLRPIVYHEILHAVYGVPHDEKCPLMRKTHKPLSKEVCQERFQYWAKKKRSL